MTRILLLASLMTALSAGARAQGTDPNLGRFIASNCANCHGTNGASIGGMPSLAGRQRAELLQQLKDFREGKRHATIMHQLAKGYSDAQLEAVATYLSAQKPN